MQITLTQLKLKNKTINTIIDQRDINPFLLINDYSQEPNDFYLEMDKFVDNNSLFKPEKVQSEIDDQILYCDSGNEQMDCDDIRHHSISESKPIEILSEKLPKKSFSCDIDNCLKTYKSRENLNLHVKNIHHKIKPYNCRFCEASFSHRNGKTYHERKFHINYLPYKCSYDGNI